MVTLRPKLLIPFFLVLFTGAAASAQQGGSVSSLDKIVAQIDDLVPEVEGYVISVENKTLTLDLKQGDPIQVGDKLNLLRFGDDIVHPVTKKKVGRKETDLGAAEIIDVRKDFSLARAVELKGAVRPGDGVRGRFRKIVLLIAPPQAEAEKKQSADRLKWNLEQRFKKHPRFEVPAFDLELWMLENGIGAESLVKKDGLQRLRSKVKADFILLPRIRSVKGKSALSYRLVSAKDGTLQKRGRVLTGPLPKSAPQVAEKQPREQDVQSDFASSEGMLTYAGRHELPFEVVDLDVGDVNGDGEEEVIVIDRHRILLFQYRNNALKRIGQIKTREGINWFLTVDVGDINGNGRDEIFVTNQMDSRLESFVLEFIPGSKKPKKIWKDVNFYFRIIRPPDSGPRLMAQSPGFRDPFHGPIRWIEFKNNAYQEGRELAVPDIRGTEFILYGLTQTDVTGDGHTDTILLDTDYHLRVYSASGRLLVKSNDYYGHDPRQIDVGVTEDVAGVVTQGEPVQFKGRLEFVQAGEKQYLLLPKNHRLGGEWLARAVVIENSSIVVLQVTAEGLEKAFETKKQKGYLAAYQVMNMRGTPDKKVHVATVVKEGVFGKHRSTIFTYDLKSR